jgi:hypothetical protein
MVGCADVRGRQACGRLGVCNGAVRRERSSPGPCHNEIYILVRLGDLRRERLRHHGITFLRRRAPHSSPMALTPGRHLRLRVRSIRLRGRRIGPKGHAA